MGMYYRIHEIYDCEENAKNENINDTSIPKNLEVHIFPGRSNTYQLYEDDGYSSLFESGYYIVTNIDYNYLQNKDEKVQDEECGRRRKMTCMSGGYLCSLYLQVAFSTFSHL